MTHTPLTPERHGAAGAVAITWPPVDGAFLADFQAKAQEAAALLKSLANPDRLLLLCQLVDAERSVTELGERTGLTQPSLSQQLGVLRGERLVATRRDGKHVFYRVESPAALAVLQTLYGLFCEAGAAPPPQAAPRPTSTPRRVRRGVA